MNQKPVRVQLSRKKGWRLPANTVNVARPSKWGNPFRVNDLHTRASAVESFRAWLDGAIPSQVLPPYPSLADLRGKDLACWCPLDQPCHADVLLELANRPNGLCQCGHRESDHKVAGTCSVCSCIHFVGPVDPETLTVTTEDSGQCTCGHGVTVHEEAGRCGVATCDCALYTDDTSAKHSI